MQSSKNPITEPQKDQIITTFVTLRKLQKQNIIPSQISPTNLQTNQIKHPKPANGIKYLLVTTRNIIYYGQLNQQGYPESSKGYFIYSDGSYYQGSVKNGKPDGQGKITNLEGSYMYAGVWKKGVPDGMGKQVIGDNVYEGEFHQGKKNGKGKLKYGDGTYYEGNFESNIIQGQGKFLSKNNYWDGNWKNGYLEGLGRQIIAKNEIKDVNDIEKTLNKKQTSVYVGEFSKGEKSGFGNFKWNKNYEYEGKFQKGQLHGEGTFKFKGKVYAGVWSNGTQVKISQLKRGVPSIILKGNIKKDGNIVMTNEGINENENEINQGLYNMSSEVQKGSSTAQISGMQKKWKSEQQKNE